MKKFFFLLIAMLLVTSIAAAKDNYYFLIKRDGKVLKKNVQVPYLIATNQINERHALIHVTQGQYTNGYHNFDANIVNGVIDALTQREANPNQWSPELKAFGLVVIEEINILRTNAGMSARSNSYWVNKVKQKL